ncbi:hypothetical protein BH11PSE2_BH11PSE2_19190 [soil metagenome]
MRAVLPFVIGALIVAALPAAAPAADKEALKASIAKSMALLDSAQPKFERQATCASCHNQIAPMIAAVAIRGKNLPINEAVFTRQVAMSAEVIRRRHDYSLIQGVGGGSHAVTSPTLVGLAQVNFPADENTDAAVGYLLGKQSADGSWPGVAVRYPHGATNFDQTATAVRAIDAYAPPSMRKQADASIARARAWLIATPATNDNEGLTYRLQALAWAKASAGEVGKARTQLAASQLIDGGWAQNPGMASDAYATGGALVALHTAGMKPSDPVYQRGLDYLLKTQAADGSWYVKAHALPIQPPIDSGFPYGTSQWISAWGTAYAAEAMAYAL